MKGSASGYGVSGSGSYSKTDYQEHRKDTVLNFGLILIVFAAIIIALYFFMQKAGEQIASLNPFAAVSTAYNKAAEETVQHATYPIPVTQARDENGNYYSVTTPDGLRQKLDGTGILKPLVVAGSVITGGKAEEAGAVAAQTVNRLGLNNEYDRLDPISKTFVSVGEGAGMLFGLDIIQMGHDMKSQVDKANGVL